MSLPSILVLSLPLKFVLMGEHDGLLTSGPWDQPSGLWAHPDSCQTLGLPSTPSFSEQMGLLMQRPAVYIRSEQS